MEVRLRRIEGHNRRLQQQQFEDDGKEEHVKAMVVADDEGGSTVMIKGAKDERKWRKKEIEKNILFSTQKVNHLP